MVRSRLFLAVAASVGGAGALFAAETVGGAPGFDPADFAVVRINDAHETVRDAALRAELGDVWRDRPDLRRAVAGDGVSAGLDLGQSEALRHQLALVRERAAAATNAPGLLLDFTDALPLFRPGCDRFGAAAATRLVFEAKAACAEQGRIRGRPLALAVRLPVDAATAPELGLRPDEWKEAGLVDGVICAADAAAVFAPAAPSGGRGAAAPPNADGGRFAAAKREVRTGIWRVDLGAGAAGREARVEVRGAPADCRAYLNSSWCARSDSAGGGLHAFAAPPGVLHDGWNAVEICGADGRPPPVAPAAVEIVLGGRARTEQQFWQLSVKADHPDGMYAAGQDLSFAFRGTVNGEPASCAVLRVGVREPGRVRPRVEVVRLDARGRAQVRVAAPRRPGGVLVEAMVEARPDGEGRVASGARTAAGAMCGAEELRAAPPPPDFMAFWAAELEKLRALPPAAKRREMKLSDAESQGGKVREWEVFAACTGPRPATGYVAAPRDARPKSVPILLTCQDEEGIAAARAHPRAAAAIVVSPNKFGVPNGMTFVEWREKGYYARDVEGFAHKGSDSREGSFFKWMILRDLRLLEYAKGLPEWNGEIYAVGEGLGAAQALAVAALDPAVRFVCAASPALADLNGRRQGRRNGWPFLWRAREDGLPDSAEGEKASRAAQYVDVVNFCASMKQPAEVWIGTVLGDERCPPEGAWAAHNALPAAVERHLWHHVRAERGAEIPPGVRRLDELLAKAAKR